MRDFDEVRGTLSVTKARVYGVDKDATKTHEDRVIQLCPRAIAVLTRQLALHRHLKSRGRIDHDQLFFKHDGAPIRISWVPGEVLAQKLRAIGLEVPAPLLRPAHLRQLESHNRRKSALCLPTARTQRHDHVAHLCGVDGGCTGKRHRADPGGYEQRRTNDPDRVDLECACSGRIWHSIGHSARNARSSSA